MLLLLVTGLNWTCKTSGIRLIRFVLFLTFFELLWPLGLHITANHLTGQVDMAHLFVFVLFNQGFTSLHGKAAEALTSGDIGCSTGEQHLIIPSEGCQRLTTHHNSPTTTWMKPPALRHGSAGEGWAHHHTKN